MSLNGTLETFALPDVLALLAATRKTGELRVQGGQGGARIWLDEGRMVAADVPGATTFADAVFEMLRLTSGTFAFDNDSLAPAPGEPVVLEPLVVEAQARLEALQAMEAFVPSPAWRVSLVADAPDPLVTVTADQWRALVAVAGSSDVAGVMGRLGLADLPAYRIIEELVDAGLVSVDPPPPATAQVPSSAPAGGYAGAPEPAPQLAPAEPVAEPAAEPVAEPAPEPAAAIPATRLRLSGLLADIGLEPSAVSSPPDDEGAEAAPEAPAPAAASSGPGPATGPDGAGTEPQDDDEPINRGLLLKFLNSVRS